MMYIDSKANAIPREARRMPLKQRINMHIAAEQWTALQALRKHTGAPIAELVRRAIDGYLQQHPPPRDATIRTEGLAVSLPMVDEGKTGG